MAPVKWKRVANQVYALEVDSLTGRSQLPRRDIVHLPVIDHSESMDPTTHTGQPYVFGLSKVTGIRHDHPVYTILGPNLGGKK